MIGFKAAAIGAALLLTATAAPTISGNQTDPDKPVESESFDDFVEEVESESFVEVEEESESIDLPDESYTISGNNSDTFDHYNDVTEEESEYRPSISGNEVIIDPYSDYDGFDGSISSAYVEYFRGFLSKLGPDSHYVCARTGQYTYIFASSDDLTFNGVFSGSNVFVVTLNTRYDISVSAGAESTFTFDPHGYMCYSDLSDQYPSLATSSDISLRQIVFVIGISIVFYTLTSFLRRGNRWVKRRKHLY